MTAAVPAPVDIIRDLRDRALTTSAADLGFTPSLEHPNVFGVVMDIGHPDALITLVSFVDGSTSLYFGSGGGIIGAGEHEPVRQATRALLARAERDLEAFQAADEPRLPAIGAVRFHVRTYRGARSAEAPEAQLVLGSHALSAVFIAAHAVITAVRVQNDGVDS